MSSHVTIQTLNITELYFFALFRLHGNKCGQFFPHKLPGSTVIEMCLIRYNTIKVKTDDTHVKSGQLSVAHPVKFSDELDGFLTEHPGTGEQPTRTQKNEK